MVFQRSNVNWNGGLDVSSVYVHSAICVHLFGVMVFQKSFVTWCSGVIDVSSVYVHSSYM